MHRGILLSFYSSAAAFVNGKCACFLPGSLGRAQKKRGGMAGEPLPSAHCVRSHLPQGDGFSSGGKLFGSTERRPLGGAAERSEAEGVFCAQKSPGGRVLSGERNV